MAADNKQAQQVCMETALAVVSQKARPVHQKEWSLWQPDALKENSGAYFFAPGKLANQDLEGVE